MQVVYAFPPRELRDCAGAGVPRGASAGRRFRR
jgi:hypothetical protein